MKGHHVYALHCQWSPCSLWCFPLILPQKSIEALFKGMLNECGAVLAHFYLVSMCFSPYVSMWGRIFFFLAKLSWLTYSNNVAVSWNCQEKDYLENEKKTKWSFFLHASHFLSNSIFLSALPFWGKSLPLALPCYPPASGWWGNPCRKLGHHILRENDPEEAVAETGSAWPVTSACYRVVH